MSVDRIRTPASKQQWKAHKRATSMLKKLGRPAPKRETISPYDPDLNPHRVLFPTMKDRW